jgi:triosephosphate isomerase
MSTHGLMYQHSEKKEQAVRRAKAQLGSHLDVLPQHLLCMLVCMDECHEQREVGQLLRVHPSLHQRAGQPVHLHTAVHNITDCPSTAVHWRGVSMGWRWFRAAHV